MGTSNFLYRDTLYALSTFVAEGECTCDADAIAVGCEHEPDCPAVAGYHDEFLYDNTRNELMLAFKNYKPKHITTAYEVANEWTNDNRNFEGAIVGRAYYNVDKFAYTLGIENIEPDFDLSIGDDYCLRAGYYEGFNFDRTTGRGDDYGCDELDELSDDLYERLTKYDEADIAEWVADREAEVQDGLFDNLSDACEMYGLELPAELKSITDTDELQEYIAKLIHANMMENVKRAVAEMDELYHTLGKEHFDSYQVSARFSNGETWYEKTA